MNTISLINKVKYNRFLFRMFKFLGKTFINVLKLFVVKDDKLILFVCFGGRKYDDSPRCIYEQMLKDPRFNDYKMVWAFMHPENFGNVKEKIKIDTFKYYITALKACVWVTNSAVDRGLGFKSKHTFQFCTWHGSAIKCLGNDTIKKTFGFSSTKKNFEDRSDCDVFCAQSKFDVEVFNRAFNVPIENFRIIGLPRNDELVYNNKKDYIDSIKNRLQIPKDKKVILYAPTFREFDRDSGDNCMLLPPMDIKKWEEWLGKEYILLFRAHYEVVKTMNFEENDFIKNMSTYPNLNELMLISDVLLSDYSSIFFDYSILERPMVCWAYDKEKYLENRGMYFDISEVLGDEKIITQEELVDVLLNLDVEARVGVTRLFKSQYVEECGSASQKSADIILDYLNLKNV